MASTYCHSLSIVYYLHIEVYDMNIDKISWIFCSWMLLWQFSCFLDILVPLAGTLRLVSIFLRWKVWCLWGTTHWFFSRSEELLEKFFGDVLYFCLFGWKFFWSFIHCFSKLFLPSSHKMGVHLHAGWSIKSAQIFFRLCWPVSVVPRLSKVSRRSWIDPKIRWEDRFSHCIMEIPTWDLLDWTDKIGFVTSLRWIELCSLPGICSGTQNVEIQISLR